METKSKKRIRPKRIKKELPLNPKQIDLLRFYLDPKSPTYGNMLQSAMKAGFSENYALNITSMMPDWLYENIGKRERLLVKAERNIDEILDLETNQEVYINGESVGKKVSSSLLKIKQDTSHFIAETVGKKHYSKRTEMTGADGDPLLPEQKAEIDALFDRNIAKQPKR